MMWIVNVNKNMKKEWNDLVKYGKTFTENTARRVYSLPAPIVFGGFQNGSLCLNYIKCLLLNFLHISLNLFNCFLMTFLMYKLKIKSHYMINKNTPEKSYYKLLKVRNSSWSRKSRNNVVLPVQKNVIVLTMSLDSDGKIK